MGAWQTCTSRDQLGNTMGIPCTAYFFNARDCCLEKVTGGLHFEVGVRRRGLLKVEEEPMQRSQPSQGNGSPKLSVQAKLARSYPGGTAFLKLGSIFLGFCEYDL